MVHIEIIDLFLLNCITDAHIVQFLFFIPVCMVILPDFFKKSHNRLFDLFINCSNMPLAEVETLFLSVTCFKFWALVTFRVRPEHRIYSAFSHAGHVTFQKCSL